MEKSQIMSECKHGLRQGCAYCHARSRTTAPAPKRRAKTTRLSEQMNDRMTSLKKRLRELRGQ
jgi:radical SAM superfamily enzyme